MRKRNRNRVAPRHWTRGDVTMTKTLETRLRRMAERQGLALHKSRRRDPYARDYGQVWLRWFDPPNPETSDDAWVGPFESLEEVERWFAIEPDKRPIRRYEGGSARHGAVGQAVR